MDCVKQVAEKLGITPVEVFQRAGKGDCSLDVENAYLTYRCGGRLFMAVEKFCQRILETRGDLLLRSED